MNRLSNEEIVSIFHLYHKSQVVSEKYNAKGVIKGIINNFIYLKFDGTKATYIMCPIESCMLKLYSLQSITEYHAFAISRILLGSYALLDKLYYDKADAFSTAAWHAITHNIHYRWTFTEDGSIVLQWLSKEVGWKICYLDLIRVAYVYQYCREHSFDTPLFFGIDHWATAKTAIQLGVATTD